MALTRHLTKQIEIPHEAGQSITIRKLSHHQLMMAVDAVGDRAATKFAKLGETAKHIPSPDDPAAAKVEAEKPVNKYDRLTVLRYGITAWSYGEDPTEETISDLDEATAAWAFDEIIAFSVRGADEMGKSETDSPSTSNSASPPADGQES